MASQAHTQPIAVAEKPARRWTAYLPILLWLPHYDRAALRPDLVAGVTVAAFAIPESMAHVGLAGLPPQFGLYTSMMAMIVCALFGISRQLGIVVTSALSIMLAGILAALAGSDPTKYAALAGMTAILVAGIALVAGLFRQCVIVNFISESVLKGFFAGAALYIASSQLPKLFGIEGVNGNFFERIWNVLSHLGERFLPRLPNALIVVLLSIVLMSVTNLRDRGIKVAGNIPRGFPAYGIPHVSWQDITAIKGLAFGVFLLSYVEGMAAERTFATRHKYAVEANQELFALSAANLAAGVSQGYPIGVSMSRSAVVDESGAQTQLAEGIGGQLLLIVVLFLTGIFSKLPEPILAAVVLIAVRGLVDIPALGRIFRLSKRDFAAAMLTMFGVLAFDMLTGILIGAIFSLLSLAARASSPRTAELGRVPGTEVYGDIARHAEDTQTLGALVNRIDRALFYANADTLKADILRRLDAPRDPPIRPFVLAMEASPVLDLAGADMLRELRDDLADRGVTLRLAEATGNVRDNLRPDGLRNLVALPERETISAIIAEWQQGPEVAADATTSAQGGGCAGTA